MAKAGETLLRSFVRYPSSIPGQFVIGREASLVDHPIRPGWRSHRVGNVRVLAAPDVPIVRAISPHGAEIGLFIGEPIDPKAEKAVTERYETSSRPQDAEDLDAWVESEVYRLSGSYVFVLCYLNSIRIYLDPDGMLPVVYDPDVGIAGSTAAAIYSEHDFASKFDARLFDSLDILNSGSFPAGLTAHRGLRRLLCNFYLDLQDWAVKRHWPVAEIETSSNVRQSIARITTDATANIRSYLATGKCCFALTGGNETRLLLAILRDVARSVQFVCFCDDSTNRDRIISGMLADRFGLDIRYLNFPPVTDDEADEWMARIGYCAGEHRYRYKASEALPDFDYFVGGLGGEVGRGFLWRPGDETRTLTAKDIYKRLMLPPSPAAEAAVEGWFPSVGGFNSLLQLDLAYLELRMCCWAAVQRYGIPGNQVHPLISRSIYREMLALPADWRREKRWMMEAIRQCRPELLTVPINKLGAIRDTLRLVQRVVRSPSLLARRWRRWHA